MKYSRNIILLLTASLASNAFGTVVIDFGAFAQTPNLTPFEGLTEDDFIVAPGTGDWFVGNSFGDPTPSIFSDSQSSSVEITSEVFATFQLESVDFADAGVHTPATFLVEGFLDNQLVFQYDGVTNNNVFATYANPFSMIVVNRLSLNMFQGFASYNIDNIVLNEVPAPGAVGLLGLAGIGLTRRRRT